jgi:hypothetical protein
MFCQIQYSMLSICKVSSCHMYHDLSNFFYRHIKNYSNLTH